MLHIDKSKWEIHDADNILRHKLEEFDLNILKFGGDIHPREDLMQLTHNETNFIIDFGYYGCEIKLDGLYIVYVIDGNREDAWVEPLERHESNSFLEGIKNVQTALDKNT